MTSEPPERVSFPCDYPIKVMVRADPGVRSRVDAIVERHAGPVDLSAVTERSSEIGIRMALGASPRAVFALVMKEGAVLVGAGALAGVAGTLFLTRYLATLLYGVTPTDPFTYAAVVIGLALAASAASFLPARRAAVLDPVVALRHE